MFDNEFIASKSFEIKPSPVHILFKRDRKGILAVADISKVKAKKIPIWVWVVGITVVGGIVTAAGGGDGESSPQPTIGTVTVSWE